jgi:hypothetical protein
MLFQNIEQIRHLVSLIGFQFVVPRFLRQRVALVHQQGLMHFPKRQAIEPLFLLNCLVNFTAPMTNYSFFQS